MLYAMFVRKIRSATYRHVRMRSAVWQWRSDNMRQQQALLLLGTVRQI